MSVSGESKDKENSETKPVTMGLFADTGGKSVGTVAAL